MTLNEMIAVLQAAKDGKVIQWRMDGCEAWNEKPLAWDFQTYQYRIKPEHVTCRCRVTHQGNIFFGDFSNLELEFLDGVLTGAKVL